MNDPQRLRDTRGPAGVLMGGAKTLRVPRAARQRALAFTGTAASIAATTGAAAASTSLVKSVVLCVALGAAGGGVLSLAAAKTASYLQSPTEPSRPAPVRTPSLGSHGGGAPRATEAARPAAQPASQGAVPEPTSIERSLPEPSSLESKHRAQLLTTTPAAPFHRAAPAVTPSPEASLFEEQRFIDTARAAMARGDSLAVLSALDSYDRAYPRKQFGPEALALRVEALRASGQSTAARALAENFARWYPHHPLLPRVRTAIPR